MRLRQELIEASQRNPGLPAREIFDNIDDGSLDFVRESRRMLRGRRRLQPLLPQTSLEASHAVMNSPYADLVVASNGEYIMLRSPELITHSINADELFIDATFKVVPRIYRQLLTVGFIHTGHVS